MSRSSAAGPSAGDQPVDPAHSAAAMRGHAAEQRILEALTAMRPLPDLLDTVVEGLEDQLPGAVCCVLREGKGHVRVLSGPNLGEELRRALEDLESTRLPGWTASDGREPVVVTDIATLPAGEYRDVLTRANVRSLLLLPVRTSRGVFGTLAVHRPAAGAAAAYEVELAARTAAITGVLIERAISEEALRSSEERLRQIAESLRDGIWISDAQHELLYVSPSAARITGLPLEAMYASTDAILHHVHPDDRPLVDAWYERPGEADLEFRLLRPDGSERWVRTHVVPIRDADGVIYRFAGVIEDITDWKRAVDALRERESHYRRLVTTAPVGIYAVDAAGAFTELNPVGEAILGRRAAEVVGRNFVDFVAQQDVDAAVEAFTRLVSGEAQQLTMELSIVRPSGEQRLIELTVSAIAEDGRVGGLHGIGRDVTEERQREQELRRAERLASVGTLIGGVAHELNNPLTAVRGLSELMLADERSEDDSEMLTMIRRESERMAKIVSDLRRLARQTQDSDRERSAVDLNEIVHHVLRVRRYTLQTSNVEVVEQLEGALPPVCANAAELEQVLLNLLVNAEQALASAAISGKRVVVRTRRAGSSVALHVSDNGPGIPRESLERIFDPFYTTKDPGVGTGLGLSLVNNIVRDHNGTVRAHSRPGHGAEFVVELPTTDAPARAVADASQAGPRPDALHVLVVEDEATIQSMLVRMLDRRGHRVTTANDGADALRLIDAAGAATFDVILSDLRMPGLNGQDMLRVLRERGGALDRRVVFMTGDAVSEDSERILGDAGVPVLMKPFTIEQVAGTVERVAQQAAEEAGRTL